MCCHVEKAHGTEKTEEHIGEAKGYTEVGNWNRYGGGECSESMRREREKGRIQGKGGMERDGENMRDNADGI